MASEREYELEDVPATLVESGKIDGTFRSSCIGRYPCFIWCAQAVSFLAKNPISEEIVTTTQETIGEP
jgi:hypothetical protein